MRFCPKLIVGGSSAYPRDWDYKRLREIADKVDAKLLIDMAHFSGLVAAGILNSPFAYADVVTTTTHKSLRATRSAMIFCKQEYKKDINSAVFPGNFPFIFLVYFLFALIIYVTLYRNSRRTTQSCNSGSCSGIEGSYEC